MKKYIMGLCCFFITNQVYSSHAYHKQGAVKHADGRISPKIPVYSDMVSNSPTGDSYIRTGTISGHAIGTLKHTSRKKNRKGTYTISTTKQSVIEDDIQHPLATNSVSGATKNIVGFVRNPHYSEKTAGKMPKNIPLYEYTGAIQQASKKSQKQIAQK